MSDFFKINDISSDSLGLHVDTPDAPPMAQKRYTTWQSGTDEDGTLSDETFSDINYSINAYVFKRADDYDNTEIYKFIEKAKTLQISRLPRYYFKIRQASISPPMTSYDGNKIVYTFNFVLAPFKYILDDEIKDVSNDSTIINVGNRYAKPTFYITANADTDVTLTVNGENFEIKGIPSGHTVTVDCGRYVAANTTDPNHSWVVNNMTYGYFPFLSEGSNYISWTGNATVKVKVNARCY